MNLKTLIRITQEAEQFPTPEKIANVFEATAELDNYYFCHYANFRIQCVHCLHRNYFHPLATERVYVTANSLVQILVDVYENSSPDEFVEHEEDPEVYEKLLEMRR